ncbi:MAG: hypothetical protein AB7S36_14275, partial [Planctomycetota bacterium]
TLPASTLTSRLFVLSGLSNIGGVLLFSAAFTDPTLGRLYPEVFAPFGLVAIILWGLAYIAVARTHPAVPWLVLVFAIEKAVYVATWIVWMANYGNRFGERFSTTPMPAAFFVLYGPNDLAFGVFFLVVFVRLRKAGATPEPGATP